MSFRNARRQMSSQVARAERNQFKLQKLRDQVRQSTNAFMARQHARLAWWQSAFRTPVLGFYRCVCSKATSLWAAFMALLGFTGKSWSTSANRRPVTTRQSLLRTAMCEGLEQRQLMAVLTADQPLDYVITNDTVPAGFSAGDTVTWKGFNGAIGGGDDIAG